MASESSNSASTIIASEAEALQNLVDGGSIFNSTLKPCSPELRDANVDSKKSVMFTDKKTALEHIDMSNPVNMKLFSEELRDDVDVVRAAMKKGAFFTDASERIRTDLNCIFKCLSLTEAYDKAPFEMRQNDDFMRPILSVHGKFLPHASIALRDDEEVVFRAVVSASKKGINVFGWASLRLRSCAKFVIRVAEACDTSVSFITQSSDKVRDCMPVMLKLIEINADYFRYASMSLQKNPRFVCRAEEVAKQGLQWGINGTSHIWSRDCDDASFMKDIVSLNSSCFKHASKRLRDEREFVLHGINVSVSVVESAGELLRNTHEVMMPCLVANGLLLEHGSETIRDDQIAVMAALQNNPLALQFASERLRDDLNVVRFAVERTPKALKYASERIRKMAKVSVTFEE